MISPPGEQGVGSGGGLGNLESGMRFLGKPIRNPMRLHRTRYPVSI
jgi:hypothetical protein